MGGVERIMRTGLVCFGIAALVAVGCSAPPPAEPRLEVADVFEGRAGRWVDLTYSFSSETIYWPTGEPFQLEEVFNGVSEGGYYYSSFNYGASEHGGTHLDAPVHFAEGAATMEQIALERLIGPAAVVDVTDVVDPDYQIQVSDVERWERTHGRLPQGVILLFRTGWGSRWPDRKRFLGTELTGPEAVPELHFPGISPDAAQWLVDEREVGAVGIDTPSIDYGQSTTFEAHQNFYRAELPGLENVAHLELLPESGSFVVALPMKIQGGSGGPLRIVAFVPGH
jgi:kynurenine formamidase